MTAEEIFCGLFDKYGEDFNWYMVPLSQSNGVFVEELKKELGEGHFLYHKKVWAVAKCESNDDVLYLTAGEQGGDTYISQMNEPRRWTFLCIWYENRG